MSASWEDVLQRWGGALNLRHEVYECADEQGAHPIGHWWSVDGQWHLRVDERRCVVWQPAGPDEGVRAALAWTLRMLRRQARQSWRAYAVQTMAELLQSAGDGPWPVGQTHGAGRSPELHALADEASLQRLLPGCFLWIHGLTSPRVQLANEEVADVRASVEEIVSAVAPNSWVGWLQAPAAEPAGSALLFWPLPVTRTSGAEAADHPTSPAVRELDILSHQVSELVSQLETDALLPARVVAGDRIDSLRDLHTGLSTLASAWFASLRLPNRLRVSIWGQMPIEIMLRYLPQTAVDEFVKIAEIRAQNRELKLTRELEETLQGIIAANLNVSEAARILYLHRNTLMNRIERIHEQTGYDIRHFRDALVLWLLVSLQKEAAN